MAKVGELPYDAQLRLKAAARTGSAGSFERARAIDAVYKWIDETYPELVRGGAGEDPR